MPVYERYVYTRYRISRNYYSSVGKDLAGTG